MIKQYRGSAIITALFIVTLVAILATAMSKHLQLNLHRIESIETSDKLYLASQVVAFWAMDRLSDAKQPLICLDNEGKVLNFPSKLSGIYPGVITTGALYDLQARFNLNNITNKTFLPMYLGLISTLLPDINQTIQKQLIESTENWILDSRTESRHDEWLDQYLKQKPVYLPSHQLMQHVSELRTVLGITPEIYLTLQPYVTALPEVTPINLNTAPLPLLRALGDGMSEEDARKLIALRDKKEVKDPAFFAPLLEKYNIQTAQVTLMSQYFLAVSSTKINDMHATYYAVLKRTQNEKGRMSTRLLYTSRDGF